MAGPDTAVIATARMIPKALINGLAKLRVDTIAFFTVLGIGDHLAPYSRS
jgi:hypothetical protein